jgi:hypothetical protein
LIKKRSDEYLTQRQSELRSKRLHMNETANALGYF